MTNVPLDFDIFSPPTVRKPWIRTLGGQRETGRLEHAGPEQRVEVRDVLADEVMDLHVVAAPPVVKVSRRADRTTACVEAM